MENLLRQVEYPLKDDFNDAVRKEAIKWSKNIKDFRLKQKENLNDCSFQARHSYFPLETSWHSANDLYNHELFKHFCQFIQGFTAANFGRKFKFSSMWIKIAKTGSSGKKHPHRGKISGVYYVDNGHDITDEISGKINFYPGFKKKTIIPENGNMVIFPAWLLHDVDPFLGVRERISIQWNMS